jgi:hypothetical protein
MAAESEFQFADYDGGLPFHPVPEKRGRLVLKPGGQWELHWGVAKPTDNSTFPIANYDGGFPAHPKPETGGKLLLTPDGHWKVRFTEEATNGGSSDSQSGWIQGAISRYPL